MSTGGYNLGTFLLLTEFTHCPSAEEFIPMLSNFPIRRRIPYQQGPTVEPLNTFLLTTEDPIRDMYSELGEKFEEKLLSVYRIL